MNFCIYVSATENYGSTERFVTRTVLLQMKW